MTATFRLSDVFNMEGKLVKAPYNQCDLVHGVQDSDVQLACRDTLGLNVVWLRTVPGPMEFRRDCAKEVLGAVDIYEANLQIRELQLKFPYWGHLIQNSIEMFNEKNFQRGICRKLVYHIRHGEGDHNKWKKMKGHEWGYQKGVYTPKPAELRKHLRIKDGKGQEHWLIDPPLAGRGESQADGARKTLIKLKQHLFPMPEAVYCSPLQRAMQTCERATMALRAPGSDDYYILHGLREELTGNSADILWDEFCSKDKQKHKAPPAPATGDTKAWMENRDAVARRAKAVAAELFAMDDSLCLALVYHSLLIQKTLAQLETTGTGGLMQNFMLDEAGIFAAVVEGPRATKEGKARRRRLQRGRERRATMAPREPTAFPNAPKPSSAYAASY